MHSLRTSSSFFYTDTPTSQIYTLSLHDALPISLHPYANELNDVVRAGIPVLETLTPDSHHLNPELLGQFSPSSVLKRSEEHTSELQSRSDLVCRLLLEKKKKQRIASEPLEY